MSMTASLVDHPKLPTPMTSVPHIGLASRARIVRDFVLLITVCLTIGLSVGLGMMAAVLILL